MANRRLSRKKNIETCYLKPPRANQQNMPFTSKTVLTLEDREDIADMKWGIERAKEAKRAKPSPEERKQIREDRADKKEQAKSQKKQERAGKLDAARKKAVDAATAKHQKALAKLRPKKTGLDDPNRTESDEEPCPDDIETESN
jgi:hypothetical protein